MSAIDLACKSFDHMGEIGCGISKLAPFGPQT